MRVTYLIIEQDDLWYVRSRGRMHGGYLTIDRAVRHAVTAAEKAVCAESYVLVEQPDGQLKLVWSTSRGRNTRRGGKSIAQPGFSAPAACAANPDATPSPAGPAPE